MKPLSNLFQEWETMQRLIPKRIYWKDKTFFSVPTACFRISVTIYKTCGTILWQWELLLQNTPGETEEPKWYFEDMSVYIWWVWVLFYKVNHAFTPHICLLLQTCIILLSLESECIEGLLTSIGNWTMSQKKENWFSICVLMWIY